MPALLSRPTLGLLAVALMAPLGTSAGAGVSGKTIIATRAATAPTIDGRLDDSIWQLATFSSDFLQQQPVEFGAATRRTEVAIAYDHDTLYIAGRMFVPPGDLEAMLTRRDSTGAAERLIISLDTFSDKRTAYSFAVTAAGQRAEWFHPDDSPGDRVESFDPVWVAATQIYPDRWTAEMRIPFAQLRFSNNDVHEWGININRFIPQHFEDLFWVVVPKDVIGWSSYFGKLRGIDNIAAPKRIEILPYVASDISRTSKSLVDPDNPLVDRADMGLRAGVDAKIGVGPNLTVSASVNPDFGQVEADPAVVNLSGFEVQFAERRPFFVADSQLFSGPGANYFYSRRIGGPPLGVADGDFVDRPLATRIFGAVKLTGRTASRVNIALLSALTQRADARVYDVENAAESEIAIEPMAHFAVARAAKEFGANSSRVGATFGNVSRFLGGDDALAQQFAKTASAGGVDWNLRLDDANYQLSGALGFSAITGDAAAISTLQRNNTHLFQRPDQDHVSVDPNATSLWGWTGRVDFDKRSGAWRFFLFGNAESPGFDPNGTGLLFSADDLVLDGTLSYGATEPTSIYHAWNLGLGYSQEWNFAGVRKPGILTTTGTYTLPWLWRVTPTMKWETPGLDDDLTRGGPLAKREGGRSAGLSLSSALGSRTAWNATGNWVTRRVGYSGWDVSAEWTSRPLDRVELSLLPRYSRSTDNRQYIATIANSGNNTFGSRYLFGTVARREIAVQFRALLAINPDLTLQLYAEPFASSGRYRDFGELEASRSSTLRSYENAGFILERDSNGYSVSEGSELFSFDDPDFAALSLRSTALLRWEVTPGSTLFLVWQQNRSDPQASADLVGPSNLDDAIRAPGGQTVAIKYSHWFPIN